MAMAIKSKLKHLKRFSLAFICVFVAFLSFYGSNMIVHADGNKKSTRSWLADFFNPTFSIELTNGDVIFDHKAKREAINNEINSGGTKEYSLYDRFGPDISFFAYCGEVKIQTNIVDRIYSFIADDEKLSIKKAIDILFSKSMFVNNIVYEGRIDICNNTQDPRYTAWCDCVGLGGNVSVANFYLSIAKKIEDIEAFIISDQIGITIIDFVSKTLGSANFLKILKPFYLTLCSILAIFIVINFVRYGIKYIKAAGVSFGMILGRLGYCIIVFALIALFLTSPFILNPLIKSAVQAKNSIMNESLDKVIDNGVINGSENQVEATLWYINIFDPWCNGMYERSYDEMYTKYAVDLGEVKDEQAYPMSDDNIWENWTDEFRYSCKGVVGDCKVPRCKGVNVRNWAALGYSIQSLYHIDAISGPNSSTIWPNAKTAVRNPQLYIDDFRYIDAMLNITEEFSSTGCRTGNIPVKGENAPRAYGTSACLPNSYLAIYRVFVLNIPMLLFAFKAFLYLIEMLFFGVQCIGYAIQFTVRFDEGPLMKSCRTFMDTLLKWLLMHIMLLFTISVYATTYKTFIGNIFYMLFCVIMFIEAPALTARERRVKGYVHEKIKRGLRRVKAKVTGNSKSPKEAKNRENKYSENNTNEESSSYENDGRHYSFETEDEEHDEATDEESTDD